MVNSGSCAKFWKDFPVVSISKRDRGALHSWRNIDGLGRNSQTFPKINSGNYGKKDIGYLN
jgi:hypothetical protein